ncbi:glycosyltransferase [Roseococcus sp. SDR]|uniref:glycosyltransferase n=1 Tax=Roseococcus sp. SDR TaxID=2835532 RepID=UPI001BCE509E|nr:glycosyltransferase [Roseococcus sp. SDR]MBS7791112.1 glycosyltransferase [Roseococcus sp. SDR]MBV1846426.1 glycosyltransferase [Roseococcus sp. SDR]
MSTPRFVVDLTDLLDFLEQFRTPMGVARVQMALLEAALALDEEPLFELTAFSVAQGRFVQFPAALLLALIQGGRQGGRLDEPAWLALQEARAGACRAGAPFVFHPGDRLLALGLTGRNPAQLRRLREVRQAHRVLVCVLFYDAIPLATPEHCERSLTRSFAEHFLGLCLQMDRAVAISACAARDFRLWQRRMLPHLDIPVGVMPLDARFPAMTAAAPPEWPERLADGRPFVLCVATIESRKNHALLLQAWLTLLRRHGDAVIPDLVLVGRPGFQAEPVLHLLQAAPELRRRVIHLQDVGDALLAQLYQRCLFTVFNSFYEGWGLPVTEALAHGKIPLTPDHTSLREAGGAAAQYFSPQSEPELADLAWSLIRDPAHRQHLESRIPERVRIRSWREVAEGLIATLSAEAPALPDPVRRLYFPLGERIVFEEPAVPDLPALMTPFSLLHQLLCEGEGWAEQERWAIGAGSGPVLLRLPLGAPAPEGLVLTLEIAASVTVPAQFRLRVRRPEEAPGPWLMEEIPTGQLQLVRLEIPACQAGDLVIEFDTGAPVPEEGRRPRIFFTGLMLCTATDQAAQLRYLSARSGIRSPRPA